MFKSNTAFEAFLLGYHKVVFFVREKILFLINTIAITEIGKKSKLFGSVMS